MSYQRFLWTLLLLTLLPATLIAWFVIPATADLYVPSPEYPTIQSAVNAATTGEIIHVAAGTYFENVIVNTTVTIVGENAATTIVDGGGNNIVFNIQANNVELHNLTIRNGGRRYNGVTIYYPYDGLAIHNTRIINNVVGVAISEADGNTIEDSVFINNSMYGIDMKYSSSNIIRNNRVSESAYGIEVSDTINSQVTNNTVSATSYGIYVPYSNNNNISANTLTSNSWNIYLTYSNSNIVGNNAVSDGTVGIQVMSSQGNSVFNNTASNSSYGIYLGYCGANTVNGNTASLNDWGIELYNSTGSTIKENIVKDNTWGFYVAENSKGNYIYHNNIVNNVKQAYQDITSGQNTWNTPTIPYEGNYWSDYKGSDTNGDGVGDTYLPWTGVDWYPLINPWGFVYVHDVAIPSVDLSPTEVPRGDVVNITVLVTNEGNAIETFNVTTYYNTTATEWTELETQSVTNLAPSTNMTLTFNWNTTNVSPDIYQIKAEASVVPNETDTTDNIYIDGTVTVTAFLHDIAIINVTLSDIKVYAGKIVNITVIAENQGTETETFNVTVNYENVTLAIFGIVGTQTVFNLNSDGTILLMFDWNTTDMQPCVNYTIKAEASVVTGEIDVTDNVYVDGTVKVKMAGDVNGDGVVDIKDLSQVGRAYGSFEGEPAYDPEADINSDGVIDMRDIAVVGINYGRTCL